MSSPAITEELRDAVAAWVESYSKFKEAVVDRVTSLVYEDAYRLRTDRNQAELVAIAHEIHRLMVPWYGNSVDDGLPKDGTPEWLEELASIMRIRIIAYEQDMMQVFADDEPGSDGELNHTLVLRDYLAHIQDACVAFERLYTAFFMGDTPVTRIAEMEHVWDEEDEDENN